MTITGLTGLKSEPVQNLLCNHSMAFKGVCSSADPTTAENPFQKCRREITCKSAGDTSFFPAGHRWVCEVLFE